MQMSKPRRARPLPANLNRRACGMNMWLAHAYDCDLAKPLNFVYRRPPASTIAEALFPGFLRPMLRRSANLLLRVISATALLLMRSCIFLLRQALGKRVLSIANLCFAYSGVASGNHARKWQTATTMRFNFPLFGSRNPTETIKVYASNYQS